MARFHCRTRFSCILLVALLLLGGCRQESGSAPDPSTQSPAPPSSQRPLSQQTESPSADSAQIPAYTVDELSAIGNYLPVLDEGRLQAAPPVDWHAAPRSVNYVVRFRFDKNHRLQLPRITVQSRAAEADEPRDLSKTNLLAYIAMVKQRMSDKRLKAIDGEIEPLVLGDVCCLRYVVRKKFLRGQNAVAGACEVVQTIRAGQVYSVLLDVYAGTLVQYRADAYAVMATAKFMAVDDPGAPTRSDSESGEEADRDGVTVHGGPPKMHAMFYTNEHERRTTIAMVNDFSWVFTGRTHIRDGQPIPNLESRLKDVMADGCLLSGRKADEAYDSAMRLLAENGQFTKVLVQRHQDSAFLVRIRQNVFITRIFRPRTRPLDIMPSVSQCRDASTPDARIEQNPHESEFPTNSGSTRSCPTTRCAYRRHA